MYHKITIVLERSEIDCLKKGEKVQWRVGSQDVELFFEQNKMGGHRPNGLKKKLVEEALGRHPGGILSRDLATELGVTKANLYYHLATLKGEKKIVGNTSAGYALALNGNSHNVAKHGK